MVVLLSLVSEHWLLLVSLAFAAGVFGAWIGRLIFRLWCGKCFKHTGVVIVLRTHYIIIFLFCYVHTSLHEYLDTIFYCACSTLLY